MIRGIHLIVSLALTGYALAQTPPPATATAPGTVPGPGRGAFPPVVIGPSAPVPPEVAIPRPTPAELAQVNDAVTKWIASDNSPTKPLLQKFRIAAHVPTAADECRGHLHPNPATDGSAPFGFRRDREQRQYRSLASRRLDHRLVGAGRRQQGDVRQVFRRHQDGQFRHRRRHYAGSSLGPEERRRPGISAEGDHADDRHQ